MARIPTPPLGARAQLNHPTNPQDAPQLHLDSPRPSETENTQKKRELQEASRVTRFHSCS